jgi:segregation and condensation protein B
VVNTKSKKLVESVLFSASKPISTNEIVQATGLSRKTVRNALKGLITDYQTNKDTSMTIVKAGTKFVMQLKDEYTEPSVMITQPEIEDSVLRTLALIAFHQPVKQSNLRRMAGEKIYEHVDQLSDMQLIHTKKHRNTEMITLTKKFPEYFGLDMTKPEEIRSFLAEKVIQQTKQPLSSDETDETTTMTEES